MTHKERAISFAERLGIQSYLDERMYRCFIAELAVELILVEKEANNKFYQTEYGGKCDCGRPHQEYCGYQFKDKEPI